MKTFIARLLPPAFYRALPSGLRWRLTRWLHRNEVLLFQLLFITNHDEGMWPCMIPQVAYFDADLKVLGVVPADWEPATTEINPPTPTKYTTFYVDWPDGQTILIADADGKVSRLLTNNVAGTATFEIGIRDGAYIDSLGNFVSVSRGAA